MIGSLILLGSLTFAQSPIATTTESKDQLTIPNSPTKTPYKLKHYSETSYIDSAKGAATAARFRVEKKLDIDSKIPVVTFVGILLDRNLMVTDNKPISGNANSPHFGIKSELLPDVWTWAEYRHKYWEATDSSPAKNKADPRIGIAFEREFAPIYSTWLIPEALIEFVQIQRLNMGLYDDGYGRLSARYLVNEVSYLDVYGEYNFMSFPTTAIDTRNQLRAGVRGGLRLKNFSASLLIYQMHLETEPGRYENRGPEMMTYLSASL